MFSAKGPTEAQKIADAIVKSEDFLWLFTGSENWTASHIKALYPAYEAYLKAKHPLN